VNRQSASSESKWLSQAGSAIVEFAIITPFLIMATLGVIEIGRYAYFGIVVENAARAGASYGARRLDTATDFTGMEAAATNDDTNVLGTLSFPGSGPTNSCKCWNGTAFTGTPCATGTATLCATGQPTYYVTVPVRATAHSIFRSPLMPSSMTINASATMRVQQSQ
jgi:Flp pilus assembly protein TadG